MHRLTLTLTAPNDLALEDALDALIILCIRGIHANGPLPMFRPVWIAPGRGPVLLGPRPYAKIHAPIWSVVKSICTQTCLTIPILPVR